MIVAGIAHWIPVIVVSVLAVPLAVLAAVALVRLRVHQGDSLARARLRSWTETFMVAGTLPWLWMILTPLAGAHAVRPVPFVDLLELFAGSPVIAFVQVVGNLLVFAAYGFLAPIRWTITPLAVVATAGLASVTVEAAQYLLDLGRVSSVDDVLLNAAGAGLAAVCSRRWWASER
jgi:VanZ like family